MPLGVVDEFRDVIGLRPFCQALAGCCCFLKRQYISTSQSGSLIWYGGVCVCNA